MQEQSWRKPSKNRNTAGALLLAGGAFGFALVIGWTAWNYAPMTDRTASAPADAVVAFSLRQPLSRMVAAALPQDLQQALGGGVGAYATASATDSLIWHPLNGKGRERLVSKKVGAIGFVRFNGSTLPIEAVISFQGIAVRVGRGFSGIDISPNVGNKSLIQSFPSPLAAYLSDQTNGSFTAISGLFQRQTGGLTTGLDKLWRALPGRRELLLGQAGNDVLQPFIMTASFDAGVKPDMADVDDDIRELAGSAYPMVKPVILSDKSTSKELYSSAVSLKVESRQISNGLIRRFIGQGGEVKMIYFLGNDGTLWISNYAGLLQWAITASPDNSLIYPGCLSSDDPFSVVIHPKDISSTSTFVSWMTSFHNGFGTLIFSLKQKETGLYTLCGYLR